jgi:two-component system, cell cycle sensor histidine kinase and response regulator CckA
VTVPAVPKRSGTTSVPTSNPPPVILRARLHFGPPLFGYVLSLALIAITGGARLALLLQNNGTSSAYAVFFPFLLYYPAIAAASFLAGAGPGLAAVLLGAILAILYFPDPPGPLSWIALAILGPLLATGFAHLRHIRERARTNARELANFKFIADHASDWILLLDESGHIRYANLQACADLGWTGEQLAGQHIATMVSPPQRPGLQTLLENAKAGGARPVELTFERRHKSPVLLELGCTAVRTADDHVIYAAARDIGERKQMERRLQEVRHWESLGVLAGGLAHDFNNLLTTILGHASLAKETVTPNHEMTPMLDNIISASERSAELVRMLLAISGYRSRFRELLHLDQFLSGMLQNRPLPSNIRIAKEVKVMHFRGDRRSIDVLLWSLISNAAEAYGSDGGEVKISIRSGAPPRGRLAGLEASFEEGDAGSGECLGIVVEDRGAGMRPDVLERAFEPFFSTKFTGRGLGPAAVRGIVRAYDGKLLLESVPGQGTRVEAWLPTNA